MNFKMVRAIPLVCGGDEPQIASVIQGMGSLLRDRRLQRVAAGGLVLLAVLLLWIWHSGVRLDDVLAYWRQLEDFLRQRPWCLFLALVILPGLPVPVSPLMFLAGSVWHERPMMACGICLMALALNLTWTYLLAARPARGLVDRWLRASTLQVPKVPGGNQLKLILVMRLTPGLPLFLQSYVLGFLHVPFMPYIGLSMATSGLLTSGVALSGAGVSSGNLIPVVTGIGLIVVALILIGAIRKRLGPA